MKWSKWDKPYNLVNPPSLKGDLGGCKTTITQNIQTLLAELPDGVTLVAAAKTRSVDEILEAIEAGVTLIGQNYVQEAAAIAKAIRGKAALHFIGHLQRNKVKKAVEVCDLIETVDSLQIAEEIDRRAGEVGEVMPVLLEVNSGREPQKFGVLPEALDGLVREIAKLEHIHVHGLMTMGSFSDDPETVRPYFRETKQCFDRLRNLDLPGVNMEILSMGMSDSYRTAIEESATHVRIGTRIFGPR